MSATFQINDHVENNSDLNACMFPKFSVFKIQVLLDITEYIAEKTLSVSTWSTAYH